MLRIKKLHVHSCFDSSALSIKLQHLGFRGLWNNLLNGDFEWFVSFVHILAPALTCMICVSWLQGELNQSFEGVFLRDFSTVKV